MSDSRRVWIVNQFAARPSASGGTRHYELAQGIKQHGFEALVIHAGKTRSFDDAHGLRPGKVDQVGGVDFFAVKAPAFSGNGLSRLWSTILFSVRVVGLNGLRKPSAIIGSSPDLMAALGAYVLAKRLRVPFVLEVRDVWPASLVELLGISRWHPYVQFLSWVERFLYVNSSAIIGVLPGIDRRVADVTDAETAKKVTWIPNSAWSMDVNDVGVRKEDSDVFRVVYTGAHGIPNALNSVVDAAVEMKNLPMSRNIRIDFYGDGVCKPDLEARVAALGIDFVHFHQPVPKSDVVDILKCADLAILPGMDTDLYRYGVSPNKLWGYMASGLPVLTSLRTYRNPVEESGCGLVVPPGDAGSFAHALVRLSRMTGSELQDLGDRGARYLSAEVAIEAINAKLAALLEAV